MRYTLIFIILNICYITSGFVVDPKSSNIMPLIGSSDVRGSGDVISSLDIDDCYLCPSKQDVEPCTCSCSPRNGEYVVTLFCKNFLESTDALHQILSEASFRNNHVYKLAVVNTSISGMISDSLFAPISFTEVQFNFNTINYIDRHAFSTSGDKLTTIDLRSNKISYFPWDSLSENHNLINLFLSHNQIQAVPTLAFPQINLVNISLHNNNICYLGCESFSELVYLQEIDLSHNNLVILNDNTFKLHTKQHVSINLSYNKIETLHDNALSGIKPAHLDLKFNQLRVLKEAVFREVLDDLKGDVRVMVDGNPLECDCSFSWILSSYKYNFDDFFCSRQNNTFRSLSLEDLGECR